jgi:hypothetical protein
MASATGKRARGGAAKERTAATPWGAAALVEEAAVPQRAGERRFSVVVQLLETPAGERLIRFAYTTDGSARRGPVTMRARDLERLRAALERAPVLAQALESAIADSRARESP